MKLLALDCSAEACSVALYQNHNPDITSGDILVEEFELAARSHTQRLLPMVEQVLAQAGWSLKQLDGIAFGRGPGSFTGVRIALSTVQGLAFGADLPVFPVSTLAALAQTAVDSKQLDHLNFDCVIAAIDARMDEIYWGGYGLQNGLVVANGEEHIQSPEQLCLSDINSTGSMIGVGSGWKYANRIAGGEMLEASFPALLPRSSAIARLAGRDWMPGGGCRADEVIPAYLRDEVAWQKTTPTS